jgi:hypothetical protein
MTHTHGEATRLRADPPGGKLEILEAGPVPKFRGAVEDAIIESPRAGDRSDSYVVTVAGILSARAEPPVAVKLTHGQGGLRSGRVAPSQSGAGARGLLGARKGRYRFSTAFGVLGLPPEFEVTVHAVFPGGRPEAIGKVRARHQPVRSAYEPDLQPLIVTSLARTGTTWLMRILGQHPAIVVDQHHPYEMVPGRYWMHALKVLTEPANHEQSTPTSHFEGDRFRIGHNPFFYGPFFDAPQLGRWFESAYVERQAAVSLGLIEDYYRIVASHQDQPQAVFFAEKHLPDHIQWMMWELYSNPREVFVLRDPRDMVASMVAFNEKRGYPEFGRERAANDEEWLVGLRAGVSRLVAASRARSDRARLLKYEDLVTDPVAALSPILDYLGEASSPGAIEGLLTRASAGAPELAHHRTSKSAERSIGQWRSLDRRWRPQLEKAFGDLIQDLGYS